MKHLPQLDGLRAVAILMVFVQHAFPVPLLWVGVDLFFILSGYLITNILLSDRELLDFGTMLRKFYLRRAERILPAYALMLLLVFLFARPALQGMWPYCLTFTQNIPFAFHFMPFGPLIPLWSLAVEQHFYIVWPAVVFFIPRRWVIGILSATLIIEPILRAVCTPMFHSPDPIYALTAFRLDAIGFGALAAFLLPHFPQKATVRISQITCGLGVAIYAVASLAPAFHRQANSAIYNSMGFTLNLVVLGSFFVWAVKAENTLLTRALSFSWLRGLGRISYMFYLLHVGILCMFWQHFGRVSAAIFTFTLTILLATLSWFLLEKPILHFSASRRRLAEASPIPHRFPLPSIYH